MLFVIWSIFIVIIFPFFVLRISGQKTHHHRSCVDARQHAEVTHAMFAPLPVPLQRCFLQLLQSNPREWVGLQQTDPFSNKTVTLHRVCKLWQSSTKRQKRKKSIMKISTQKKQKRGSLTCQWLLGGEEVEKEKHPNWTNKWHHKMWGALHQQQNNVATMRRREMSLHTTWLKLSHFCCFAIVDNKLHLPINENTSIWFKRQMKNWMGSSTLWKNSMATAGSVTHCRPLNTHDPFPCFGPKLMTALQNSASLWIWTIETNFNAALLLHVQDGSVFTCGSFVSSKRALKHIWILQWFITTMTIHQVAVHFCHFNQKQLNFAECFWQSIKWNCDKNWDPCLTPPSDSPTKLCLSCSDNTTLTEISTKNLLTHLKHLVS